MRWALVKDGDKVEKETYAREIPLIEKQIRDFVTSTNRTDLVLTLLSIEDAYDNLRNTLLRPVVFPNLRPQQTSEVEQLGVLNHIDLKMHMVEPALLTALNMAKPGVRTLSKMPAIVVAISGEGPEEHLETCFKKGLLKPLDSWRVDVFRILGDIEGSEIIMIEDARATPLEDIVLDTLDWVRQIHRYNFLKLATRENLTLKRIQGETAAFLHKPQVLKDEQKDQVREQWSMRYVDRSSIPVSWSSDFSQRLKETMASTGAGIDSAENRQAVDLETEEVYRGFLSFPGFKDSFQRTFGYGCEDLRLVCHSLRELARVKPPHSIYFDAPSRLISHVKQKSGLPEHKVSIIIASLTWQGSGPAGFFPIYQLQPFSAFSYIRVMFAEASRLNLHFVEAVNNDTKGKAFEKACRDLLSKSAFQVLPGSLQVKGDYLPPDVSSRLWNKVKTETDIDVVAKKGKVVFVLECKEIKPRSETAVRKAHLLERHAEELFYKATWMTSQIASGAFTPEQMKTLPKLRNGDHVIPLVVSTSITGDEESSVAVLTYDELVKVCSSDWVENAVVNSQSPLLDMAPLLGRRNVSTRSIPVVPS